MNTQKLLNLKEGDKFVFIKPKRKDTIFVVEGQYPIKKITTVFSEPYLKKHKHAEPIAVNNQHNVKLLQSNAYHITHNITKNK